MSGKKWMIWTTFYCTEKVISKHICLFTYFIGGGGELISHWRRCIGDFFYVSTHALLARYYVARSIDVRSINIRSTAMFDLFRPLINIGTFAPHHSIEKWCVGVGWGSVCANVDRSSDVVPLASHQMRWTARESAHTILLWKHIC